MKVNMYLDKSADDLVSLMWRWSEEGRAALEKAFTRAVFRWSIEAGKRVPNRHGHLKNSIQFNTYWEGGELIGEVGTNVKEYPDYLEFGTRYIAGGAVAALGTDPDITDAQAIHTWPAKESDAAGNLLRSKFHLHGKLYNENMQAVRGPQEQMPWLRPAFASIRDWVAAEINSAYSPPKG